MTRAAQQSIPANYRGNITLGVIQDANEAVAIEMQRSGTDSQKFYETTSSATGEVVLEVDTADPFFSFGTYTIRVINEASFTAYEMTINSEAFDKLNLSVTHIQDCDQPVQDVTLTLKALCNA